jgi:16S rRNA (adenine1518-N6/adenine1519-N6)-dimethyltransferase
MDLQTTKSLLRKHGFRPKKRLGQHFLVDPAAAQKIIAAAGVSSDDTVLEIGSGLGALTEELLCRAGSVIAVELDTHLCAILTAELGAHPQLTVVNEDFLNVNIPELAQKTTGGGLKIVGNLPYQITGPAVRIILDNLHLIRLAVITVQREVADRILARPGGKTFGILSVAAQYYSQPQVVLSLAKEAFYPQPQIASTVLMLTPRSKPPVSLADEEKFFTVVKALFGHRRKTARNALRIHPSLRLSQGDTDELSRRTGIDLRRRAETMSLHDLARISNAIWEIQHAAGQN